MLNAQSQRKITDLCQQYNFSQLLNEPTNYSESSASIIDLIMVSNLHSVDISGVGEPFLISARPRSAEYMIGICFDTVKNTSIPYENLAQLETFILWNPGYDWMPLHVLCVDQSVMLF